MKENTVDDANISLNNKQDKPDKQIDRLEHCNGTRLFV